MILEFPSPLELVDPATIDSADETFAVSPSWRLPRPLKASIERVGILTPLLAEPNGAGRLRIVDGFLRFRAALRLQLTHLPVRIGAAQDTRERFLARLEARLATRPPDELETALVLWKLKHRFQFPERELVERFLPLLGLRPERFQLRRQLDLAVVAPRLQQAFPALHRELAAELNHWPDEAQSLFLDLLARYRLSLNHQKEIFGLLDELGQAGAGGPEGVLPAWQDSGAAAVDADFSLTPQQRLEDIRAKLRLARHPTLATMEARAEQLRAALRIPPQIHFNWPRFFEGNRIDVRFAFGTPEELEAVAVKLREMAAREEVRELLELL